jgi:hypothetical protein
MASEGIKLNLGGGNVEMPGYMNIDHHNGKEAYPLDIADNSVEEIRASHILEHFSYYETGRVLQNWFSKLKPGGTLKVAVPDFKRICDKYSKGDGSSLNGHLFGGQISGDDFHKATFDEGSLTALLQSAGFCDVRPWAHDAIDSARLSVSLNLMAIKPGSNMVRLQRKISFAMSTPRLTFTENAKSLLRTALQTPAMIEWGEGAFWSQVLTRTLEKCLDNGSDYIFTVDYDTWFTNYHVQKMLTLMEENPEYDAIIPMQARRDNAQMLFGIIPTDGTNSAKICMDEFQSDVLKVDTGHFGLSVFRPTSLMKLKKPWFLGVPDDKGGWDDGHIDDDIYFWKNMASSGLKVGLAHKVLVGHMQLMCTFPGKLEDKWNPVHCYLTDVNAGKIPSHCI